MTPKKTTQVSVQLRGGGHHHPYDLDHELVHGADTFEVVEGPLAGKRLQLVGTNASGLKLFLEVEKPVVIVPEPPPPPPPSPVPAEVDSGVPPPKGFLSKLTRKGK